MSLRDKDVDTPELAYLSACARFQPFNHFHREAATCISKLRRRESASKLKSGTASNTKDTDIRKDTGRAVGKMETKGGYVCVSQRLRRDGRWGGSRELNREQGSVRLGPGYI